MPPKVSIIIPTIGRKESLQQCLESIWNQTFEDYEIIKVTEEGELASLRNYGASKAIGKYLVFIDDDVRCSPRWLDAIVQTFQRDSSIGGVSGPSIIRDGYRNNRDIFRFRFFKWIYDFYFCDGRQRLPGHVTRSGAWTTGACDESCSYDGEVMFLEACNMAYRRDIFIQLGGFDTAYKGVGDWSEPDLSFRATKLGYKLWFSRDAVLEHFPSKSGAFKKRSSDARNRMANYELFGSRWIKPSFKHNLYKQFLRTYYALETFKQLHIR